MLALILLLQLAGAGSIVPGQGGINGYFQASPTISALTASPDANTIVLSWTTSVASDSKASCSTHQSPDNGVAAASTSHVLAVSGLTPSTGYTCTVQSGVTTQNVSSTTTALPATTPITGASITTFSNYNTTPTPPFTMTGDTYYNTVSSDGVTYLCTMDTSGWNGMAAHTSALQLAKFTSESPLIASTVNYLSAYTFSYPSPAAKAGGLMSIAGNLYMLFNRLATDNTFFENVYFGSLISSPDHGTTWNNYQGQATFTTTGANLSPLSVSMWPQGNANTNWATNHFVMQGADDGTVGYLVANNRVNDANEYVYIVSLGYGSGSNSAVNNNDNAYLMRVPRSKFSRQNPLDYQYYVSGDGNLDSNWSSTSTSAGAILTNSGKLGWSSIQYIPALNRYIWGTFYYPSGAGTTSSSVWLWYESPTPWGTWTQIGTQTWSSTGYYSPIIQQDTALAASSGTTTMTVLTTQDFRGSNYNMFYGTLTVTH